MYSVIATAALFTAVVLNDFLKKKRNTYRIKRHVFFGICAVGAMAALWYLDMEYVGWGLLIIPIAAIFITFLLTDSNTYTISPSAYTPPAPSTASGTGTGTAISTV